MDTVNNNNLEQKVFTVIVTYNGMQWIEDCINSVIFETTVVVVDNQSSDGTIGFIKENFSDVIVLEQNENLGFGKANNIGISYALGKNAEYLLLLNQDAKMEKGAIKSLMDASLKFNDYSILSPLHCDWKGDYLESSFSNYMAQHSNKDFYSDFVLEKPKKPIYEVPFIAAACWFSTVKPFLNVGGFDPIFKHLGEDVNLVQRFKYHGYKIGVLPNCKVMHDTGERTYEKVEKYSETYFYKLDYRSKMKFADINIDNWLVKLKYAKNQVKKEIVFAFFRLSFKHIKGGMKHLKLLDDIKLQCEKSRETTKIRGKHYLNY